MSKRIDITGQKIGYLTVLKFLGSRMYGNQSKAFWKCRCVCGKIISKSSQEIRVKQHSCGCLRYSRIREKNTKHGLCGSKFYKTYYGILDRCTNPKNNRYKNYHRKNIKCRWKNFEEFKRDMYASFLIHNKKHGKRNTSIDRINNDKGYYKENCRWATAKEQANNR